MVELVGAMGGGPRMRVAAGETREERGKRRKGESENFKTHK